MGSHCGGSLDRQAGAAIPACAARPLGCGHAGDTSEIPPDPEPTVDLRAVGSVWFCRLLGKEFGPFRLRDLRGLAKTGRLSPRDEVLEFRNGKPRRWRKAGDVHRLYRRRASRHADAPSAPAPAGTVCVDEAPEP